MRTFERLTHVDAPFETVWQFHSEPTGLDRLTPDWVGLRFERALGPEGTTIEPTLEPGVTLTYSARPLGIGPRSEATATIVDRWREGDRAGFQDELVDGPFSQWRHSHSFVATDDGTIVRDRVEFALPGGLVGSALEPLVGLGLAVAFWGRHRRTKRLLER